MYQRIRNFHWQDVSIVVFTLFILITNTIWILNDSSPPLLDMAGHSQRSALYADFLQHGQLKELFLYDTVYPPFSYTLTAVLFLVFGWHKTIPQLSLLIFVLVYILSLYEIGKHLFQNKTPALFATMLSFSFPLLLHFSRIFDLDFQQTALVTASLAALLRSEHFQKRFWTLLFGVLVALSLLTKWTASVFLVGPTIVLGIRSIKTIGVAHLARRLFIPALTVGILAGSWLFVHRATIQYIAIASRKNIFSVPYEDLLSAGNVLFYVQQTMQGMAYVFALSIPIGVILIIKRKHHATLFLLSWVVIPYLIMTFAFYSKESRYVLSMYPALALIAVFGVGSFYKHIQKVIVTVFAVFGILFWIETSWGVRIVSQQTHRALNLERTYGYRPVNHARVGYGFTHPTQYHTSLHLLPEAIKQDLLSRTDQTRSFRVTVVPNSIFLSAQQIQYYARLSGLDRIENPWKLDFGPSSLIRTGDWKTVLASSDYIVTKTGDQGPKLWGPNLEDIRMEESLPQSSVFARFDLLQSWELNGIETNPQVMRLYKKRDNVAD